jgi:nucleotide-binding universal stress UspA family protein
MTDAVPERFCRLLELCCLREWSPMYESVLVPFDFSNDSRYAVECLRALPGLDRVVLLHVVFSRHINPAGAYSDAVTDYARLRLEEFRQSVQWEGVQVRTRVERVLGGPISGVVNRVAAEEGVTLVAMGRRGRGVIETLLVGSFAADILRYGDRDILLIHAPESPEGCAVAGSAACPGLLSNVMVCTDFSAPEIAVACAETLPAESAITLFHVVETGESMEEVRENCNVARARLEELAEVISAGRGPVGISLRVGDAAEEIALFAQEKGVSLIALKSRGNRGFIHALLGSTSAAVIRMADTPILVLRQSKPSPLAEASPAGEDVSGE